MIDAKTIRAVIDLYERHGWQLRRVLLTETTEESLEDSLETLFGETETAAAKVDAVWFSRPSKGADVAWELRHLSSAPFALIEVFDADLSEDDREDILQTAELKLLEKLGVKQTD